MPKLTVTPPANPNTPVATTTNPPYWDSDKDSHPSKPAPTATPQREFGK